MADPRYRLRSTDPEYGVICPECAGPKREQSRRCADCYVAARRRGEYPNPPVLRGPEKPNWKGGKSLPKGTSRGRPQPMSHPWRAKNALLCPKGERMKLYRQGDVLVVAIDQQDIPTDVKPIDRENGAAVLAHGEITGHAHRILDGRATLVTPDTDLVTAEQARELYLLVHGDEPVDLVHQEHDTIQLAPGAYKVVRQREYTPEQIRRVAD